MSTQGYVSVDAPVRMITMDVDGRPVKVREGTTILEACKTAEIDTPTLCYASNLTPVNACRVCVVELEGARVLVPACARKAEAGMKVKTDTERVRHSRRLVLEFLGSSVDLSTASKSTHEWIATYEANPARFGADASMPPPPAASAAGETASHDRDHAEPGHHASPDVSSAATVAQAPKLDNDLYMRDYSKCILCYKCVEACGDDAQNTFAIGVAGRGFDARISTEFVVPLTDSACVYCGNCIGVCPTGALMFNTEYRMRKDGTWDESKQKVTSTICPYCGVGCDLELHVQANEIVKVTSPADNSVTSGHLCIKGRFGFSFVGNK
ncbi:MAG: (2Fe-2S)-binding protein [Vicinamibacteria bacterium]|nr:(2Fe-2S)-binding protein [Vicinamibacteria bacterium]